MCFCLDRNILPLLRKRTCLPISSAGDTSVIFPVKAALEVSPQLPCDGDGKEAGTRDSEPRSARHSSAGLRTQDAVTAGKAAGRGGPSVPGTGAPPKRTSPRDTAALKRDAHSGLVMRRLTTKWPRHLGSRL